MGSNLYLDKCLFQQPCIVKIEICPPVTEEFGTDPLQVCLVPHSGKMTGCKKENFRAQFEDGGFFGVEAL
jgi:hypothetical protein